jgi:hypothetical protein
MSGADLVRFDRPLMDGIVPAEAAIAAVQAHPGFDAAGFRLAAGVVANNRSNRLVNAVMTDRVRMLIAMWALHFHFSARPGDPLSGLTAARLRRACVERKLCSGGRVEAMIMLMRLFGHLAAAPHEEDRRLHRLTPTERLLDWNGGRLAFTFEAMAKVMPEGTEALARMQSSGFIESVTCQIGRSHLAGFHLADHVPEMRLFIERNAGFQSLTSLCTAVESSRFPPAGLIPFSISRLARNFGVSRAHLRGLLRDAETAGLLERSEPDGLRILPRLDTALRRVIALYLVQNAHCVRLAIAESEQRSHVA